ncbi:hypothetical protein jhhlp_003356 [Lomentospora prolificans]|uniref:Poly A polymerase head domain-containing protein n=1 Tax=Lomentospora prolificans TaxID=41688 RepID=A0A2N3NGR2_9PEZI|nr:hypothetical protein jhhlp_003356 [Lomentospora prolificans]
MKRKFSSYQEVDIIKHRTAMALPVQLTPNEERLKSLLLDVASSINATETDPSDACPSPPRAQPVCLRWAGGWVRDKILGIETHDIDVAINCMTGEDFGRRLSKFCHIPSVIEKHSITKADLGNLHTIKANPEKSKNLATATCRIFGADVDFVNLRKEVYSDHSRNPEIEFGTPLEDALRRDATVNALFYNLHTDQIEDFTSGIPDMKAQLIRTPLEPFQTFMDDPLRVLRLVRFASRLGFAIDDDVEKMMGDERVLKSFQAKISRERVGIEIEKMLKGNRPHASLDLIDRLGLYHSIFTDPSSVHMPRPDILSWRVAYHLLRDLQCDDAPGNSLYRRMIGSNSDAYLAWNLAAFTPWASVDGSQHPPKNKSKADPSQLIIRVAREGIKATNKLCTLLGASYRNRSNILHLKELVCSEDESSHQRDLFAMAIREWEACGGYWKLQVLYCILVEAMQELKTWPVSSDRGSKDFSLSMSVFSVNHDTGLCTFVSTWEKFFDHLTVLDVTDAPSIKPLVDGHLLARSLGVKPGKWMSNALDACLAWQFSHPEITDIDKVIEAVKTRRNEIGIPER